MTRSKKRFFIFAATAALLLLPTAAFSGHRLSIRRTLPEAVSAGWRMMCKWLTSSTKRSRMKWPC